MKVVTLLLLVAVTVHAEPLRVVDVAPPEKDKNVIVDLINVLFEVAKDFLQKHDPFEIPEYEHELTLLEILKVGIRIKELRASGFSDISVNQLEYDKSLRFDISLPKVEISLADGRVFAGSAEADAGGRIAITQAGIAGDVDFDLSNTGITVNKLQLRLKLQRIEADVRANLLGNDFSSIVNDVLNNQVVQFLEQNDDLISKLLEVVGTRLVEIISNLLFS